MTIIVLGYPGNDMQAFSCRVFITCRYQRSENSPAKFCSFPERVLLFHNNSPVTLHYSPATIFLMKSLSCLKKLVGVVAAYTVDQYNKL